MATGLNLAKYASTLYRARFSVVQELVGAYRPAMHRNKAKLIELVKEKAEVAAKSELARKMRVAKGYYRLEMAPPATQGELQRLVADLALVQEFIKSGCYKYLTVKQAWLLFLVGLEIGLWFFLGETIGKMHIVGYKV